MPSFDLMIKEGTVVLPDKIITTNIGIKNGKIVDIGELTNETALEVLNCKGLHVLPGIIDSQVHFREPGLEHKEDLESGTRAAVLGGVTAIMEMPNTNPSTTTPQALADKLERASKKAWCDHAFFVGGTKENASQCGSLERLPGCAGIKIFMGSSTGSLLVEQEAVLEEIFRSGSRRIAIHAEDEARLKERKTQIPPGASATYHPIWRDEETALLATQRAVRVAKKTGRKLHILHISSRNEMEFLKKEKGDLVTVECLPQFLYFSAPDIYEKIGSLAQMNPPIRSREHQEGLWKALLDGVVDVIATDHAPHTRQEKSIAYPGSPSGMPGVQTLVPVMLNFVNQGRISLEKFVQLCSENPCKTYNIESKGKIALGYDADFTIVDLKKTQTVEESWLATKCGWSPWTGEKLQGWPVGTIIRGNKVMWESKTIGTPTGKPLQFKDA